MADSILQVYLTNQFIPLDEEASLDKLKKAIEQLGKKLRKEKERIISYTLVALDPNTSPEEPVLQEVQDLIIKNWPVYVNKAGGNNLVTYNRAIILEALSTLSQDENLAGIIWLTGSSILKHYNLGREESILRAWLYDIGKSYEAKAKELWAVSNYSFKIDTPEFEITVPEIKYFIINKDLLRKGLSSAAGPSFIDDKGTTSTPGEKANRYWPQSNPANWAGDFGLVASDTISTVANSVFTSNHKEITVFLKQFHEAFKQQMQPYFKSLGEALLNKSNSLDLRSQLLWLKESQYSSILNDSYRNINKIILPFAIAKDVSDTILPIYPVSVDFFAKEIARTSYADIDNEMTLEELLKPIHGNTELKQILPAKDQIAGRKNLYNFLVCLCYDKADANSVMRETGIPKDVILTKADLITWMLHDLQAIKLCALK